MIRDIIYKSIVRFFLLLPMYVLHNTDYDSTAVFTAAFFIRRNRNSAKLYYQPHIFHTAAVFGAGGDDINSGGINA